MKRRIAMCIGMLGAFYWVASYAAVNSKLIWDKYGSGDEDALGYALSVVWTAFAVGLAVGCVLSAMALFGRFPSGGRFR